jgi:hypothetical protein
MTAYPVVWGWWMVPFAVVGLALVFAPVIGDLWARDFRPRNCERCGRELVGSPPVHRFDDRMYCRLVAASEGDVL